MREIVVLAFQGLFDSSLALTLDALTTANRLAELRDGRALFTVTLLHPGRREIETGQGGRYRVRSRLGARPKAALIVPGLGLTTPEEIEACLGDAETQRVLRWLARCAERFPLIGASCSAVFLLAEAGLLEGRSATTTWWLAPDFRRRYPGVALDEARMLTESDGVICAGAALAQMDLLLHLISRLAGPRLAAEVARSLAIEARPSQARYMVSSAVAGVGEDAGRAEAWARRNLAKPFRVARMAKELGMSPRTLDRRLRAATGVGPSRFVQRIRSEQAAHLIETTDLSLPEIAERVGYRDVASLRRVIRRERRANPSELRRAALLRPPG
ncbi:MAG: helix-turn-helix domain-containing protein [Myxococcota bacterium]|nr:helix-turn-helix domain-containing protein [Myxococcota bacterium]